MRVLLPLKKKLNDDDEEEGNSPEGQQPQQHPQSLFLVEEENGEIIFQQHRSAQPGTQVLNQVSAVSSFPAAAAECFTISSATNSNSSAGSTLQSQTFRERRSTELALQQFQSELSQQKQAQEETNYSGKKALLIAGPLQNSRQAKPSEPHPFISGNENTANSTDPSVQPKFPESFSASAAAAAASSPITSAARLPSAKKKTAVSSSKVACTPAVAAAPTATTSLSRLRKRRSYSPPLSPPDTKPPSKKYRDSKLPARDKATSESLTNNISSGLNSTATTTTPHNNNINNPNMAGGGNSRGGRKLWPGSSSYYVESSNGSSGREDISNSDDSAELDVRFVYRHENDPASARGDPSTMRVPLVASTAGIVSGIGGPHRRNSNNKKNVTSNTCSYAECGRDDDDVREREVTVDHPEADEDCFAQALKKKGLEMIEQEGDGNCLFRAISLQVYGDASMHGEVRHRCLDFMARDKEHFSQFITDEPFEQYIRRKRQDGVHGNNPEIQAISELFNRPIEVFVSENGATPLNIFHAEYKTDDAPIRLSYHDGNHYNAVIDPLVPTAGLGLGLPGLQPGLADKLQMAKAVAESDRMADQKEFEQALKESQNDQLQRAIKESSLSVDNMYQNKALSLSDCDATNFELEQAVLESSLESYRNFEHGRKQQASSSTGVASARRKRQASPPQGKALSTGAEEKTNSTVASMPQDSRRDTALPAASVTASASASVAPASAAAVASRPPAQSESTTVPLMAEQYPQTVQELVMNGFDLRKVVHAYELVGDDFDSLIGFLMNN